MKSPQLDALAADPAAVAALSTYEAAQVFAVISALGMALAARLVHEPREPRPAAQDRALTIEEVGARLGVSTWSVRRLLHTGALTGHRQGKKLWRVSESALTEYQAKGG